MSTTTDREPAPPRRRTWRDLPAAPPVADVVPPPAGATTTIDPATEPTAPIPTVEPPATPPTAPADPAGTDTDDGDGRSSRRTIWIVTGCVAVVAVLAAAILVASADDDSGAASVTPTVPETEAGTPAAVAEALGPAVVQIESAAGRATGLGSGVIYDASGLVLTAHHVVATADDVTVRIADDRTVGGRVVGRVPERDLAVVALDSADDLTAARIAEPDTVQVGETAIALGSPFGFEQSVTAGIVSGLDRDLETPVGTLTGLIQTDAPINPGNSGGPLADDEARVIGINTAIASISGGNDGVGFAVPVEQAADVLAEVEANGGVDAPTVPVPDDSAGGVQIPGLGQIPGLDQVPGLDQMPGLRELLEDLLGRGGGPFELDRLPGLGELPELERLLEELLGQPGGAALDDLYDDLFGNDDGGDTPTGDAAPPAGPTAGGRT